MTLLVSIHDVSPAHASAVQQLWALCGSHDILPALLVVPDWHGGWPLAEHPAFAEWLRACAGAGAEIVLPGERHDEHGSARGPLDGVRAWGRTRREGEFLTLDGSAAEGRIARGLAALHGVGLEPVGFVPPAWLARDAGHLAAGRAGLRFSEDAAGIRLFPSGRRLRSPAVRWSARTPLRAAGSAAVAELRWIAQRRSPVVRLALHPGDLAHPVSARSAARALRLWSTAQRAAPYASLWS
jgi:uncharacterized protein